MAKKTYTPEDYSPETQAAMKELCGWLYSGIWTEVANIIEKAVVTAKKVTEEKVRAACAAVAEAHLNNPKQE